MDNILFEFESEIDKKDLDTILNYISEYHLKNVINIKKINLLKTYKSASESNLLVATKYIVGNLKLSVS